MRAPIPPGPLPALIHSNPLVAKSYNCYKVISGGGDVEPRGEGGGNFAQ
jgi:hypothetical protein